MFAYTSDMCINDWTVTYLLRFGVGARDVTSQASRLIPAITRCLCDVTRPEGQRSRQCSHTFV